MDSQPSSPGPSSERTPIGSLKRQFSFGLSSRGVPLIFLRSQRYLTDSILSASVELRKRGFLVELEQELKSSPGKCNFLLSLSPTLIQKLAIAKNLDIQRRFVSYTPMHRLVLLNAAIDVIMESCTFLEGREAWIAHDKRQYDAFHSEKEVLKRISGINDYFGPQIALYFGWLNHYTSLLIYPSIFGVLTFVHQMYFEAIDSSFMPFYGIFIAIWTTVFLELSKRNCSSLAFQFNVLGAEDDEAVQDLSKVKL
jgi:hypothetical protein